MRLSDARKLLGLHNGYTASDVRQRFTELAKAGHADLGGCADMAQLVEAKDLLLANHAGDIPCPACGGRGSTLANKFVALWCERCDGNGVIGVDNG